MERREVVRKAEQLVEAAMKGNDASHDAAHVFRVRDMALSLALEEGLSSSSDSMEIVELAALLHDIGDYKYVRDPSEEKIVENFLEEEGIEESKRMKILSIIKAMGFKEELAGFANGEYPPEFGVVQDADRLDAIGAIVLGKILSPVATTAESLYVFPFRGHFHSTSQNTVTIYCFNEGNRVCISSSCTVSSGIARCFTFGGSRKRVLHDPAIKPRSDLSKEQYMKKEEQTTVNHFHEKLLKLKDLMKTKAGQRRAEKRHNFMEEFLKEFYEEWDGRA